LRRQHQRRRPRRRLRVRLGAKLGRDRDRRRHIIRFDDSLQEAAPAITPSGGRDAPEQPERASVRWAENENSRTSPAVPLAWTSSHLGHDDETTAWDDREPRARRRAIGSRLASASVESGSHGPAIAFHATQARRRSSPAPAARSWFRARKRASPSSGVRHSRRTTCEHVVGPGADDRIWRPRALANTSELSLADPPEPSSGLKKKATKRRWGPTCTRIASSLGHAQRP
jgi:hypothetical protein